MSTARPDDDAIHFSRPYYCEREAQAAARVIRGGWIVGGPELLAFEREFAERCGAAHAVGVSSWTTGAFLAMRALGIGPGDEVIVPSYTFIASVNVAAHAGATPVFADIDPNTWNVDAGEVERLIGPRTKLLLPVDQLGLPCDIDAFNAIAESRGLTVLDDAACAFGSRNRGRPVGSLCPLTVFSLHARKVVTTAEGGMIVTDDGELAARLRRLRHQGMSASDYERHGRAPTAYESYPEIGYNFRITDIQAAIGRVQLEKLDEILARRREVADAYREYLRDHPLLRPPAVPEELEPNWQSFMVGLRDGAPLGRDELMTELFERGIPTRRSVMASHLEPPYRGVRAELPHTEHAFARNLLLPIHPAMTPAQVSRVIEAIDETTRRLTGA